MTMNSPRRIVQIYYLWPSFHSPFIEVTEPSQRFQKVEFWWTIVWLKFIYSANKLLRTVDIF